MTPAPGASKTDASARKKPPRDPRTTPAMQQFHRFKKQHPDCILAFRMGDFYEMFDEDAELVHRVLGLTLTQRTEGIPMAGVPHHALEGYLQKLIAQGYRVAVCDQIQDPKEARGVVDRAVTRVLTPGTLVDEALLDEARPNQVAAVTFDQTPATIAIAEVSTGRFTVHRLDPAQLGDELTRLAPAEVLYPETDDHEIPPVLARIREALGCALTPRPAWTFRPRDAKDLLLEQYGVTTLSGFGLDDGDVEIPAAGALVRYLGETQSPDGAAPQRLAHLRPPRRAARDAVLQIDATSIRALEIERTMRSGQTAGSLLSVLQRCQTPMGKRMLRHWLCFPLRDLEAIERRQRAVTALLDDDALTTALTNQIGVVQDVARIVGRLSTGRAAPRDLVALGQSVARISTLTSVIEGYPAFTHAHRQLQDLATELEPLARTIERQCVETPPAHLRDGGLFRDGIDADLDESRLLQRDANAWLAEYQRQLTDTTGIPSLKVGYNKVFGYYIEVTHTHTERVPDTFTRKQTLKNAERYITPELKTFEEKVTTAHARGVEREKQLFDVLSATAQASVQALGSYADVVAALDVIACFADVATRYRYVRPQLVDAPVLDIRQGRHPVLDRILGERFVPNDCRLATAHHTPATVEADTGDANTGADDPVTASLALITGPNMAGKSTSIRQAAIITLLAHTGCFVPAESAVIGLTDRIFTRIGSSDELHGGQSTFMVEMTETANILHHATDRSLVILDEIGRGTSTLDGLALAWAIAETIAGIGCRALFATHYHELTDLADRLDAVTNLHVSVREWGDEIIFLYRILPGRTDRSYGIHVGKIAGLPDRTLRRASEVLDSLTVHTGPAPVVPPATGGTPPHDQDDQPGPPDQLALFGSEPHPAVDELRRLDLDTLSPMAAFDELRRIVEMTRRG